MSRVSVVIPVKDGERYLEELLEALAREGVEEVLVIDSGSRDRSLEIARAAGVELLQIEPAEFGHGRTRNLGAERTSGELICFLTQDATPVPGWLEAYREAFALDERVGAAYGPHLPRADTSPMIARELSEFFAGFAAGGAGANGAGGVGVGEAGANRTGGVGAGEAGANRRAALGPARLGRIARAALGPAGGRCSSAPATRPSSPTSTPATRAPAGRRSASARCPTPRIRRSAATCWRPAGQRSTTPAQRCCMRTTTARSSSCAATSTSTAACARAPVTSSRSRRAPPRATIASAVAGDRRWMAEREMSAAERARWTARSAVHHGGRRVFSALGSRAERVPAPLRRRLSLEGRDDGGGARAGAPAQGESGPAAEAAGV